MLITIEEKPRRNRGLCLQSVQIKINLHNFPSTLVKILHNQMH